MSKIITIYCEGSDDLDLLEKVTEGISGINIRPIGGKHGVNAIIKYQESLTTKSDFCLFFRDRDFDCAVSEKEKLHFDGNKTYYSYRTTIENYLLAPSLFYKFIEQEKLREKYDITSNDVVVNIFIKVAKTLKYYQAIRHTLGELRCSPSFDTSWEAKSGILPEDLGKPFCEAKGWELIESAIGKSKHEWTKTNFKATLKKYYSLFDDAFFNDLKFLAYFQGKDFAKALGNTLTDFPMKKYYKFAKNHFDYNSFPDLVELRKIIEDKA